MIHLTGLFKIEFFVFMSLCRDNMKNTTQRDMQHDHEIVIHTTTTKPHDMEFHVVANMKDMSDLLGQGTLLHCCSCFLSPEQSLPPYFGAGLVQNRCRLCLPVSQPLSHIVHVVHAVKPPSIGRSTDQEMVIMMNYYVDMMA